MGIQPQAVEARGKGVSVGEIKSFFNDKRQRNRQVHQFQVVFRQAESQVVRAAHQGQTVKFQGNLRAFGQCG